MDDREKEIGMNTIEEIRNWCEHQGVLEYARLICYLDDLSEDLDPEDYFEDEENV